MGISCSGDLGGGWVAALFARTSVGLVEKAGDTVRFGSGLEVGDLDLGWSSRTERDGDGARGSCALRDGFLTTTGDACLGLGGVSKVGLLSCGGVRVICGLGMCALGGGAIELEGETGTEFT